MKAFVQTVLVGLLLLVVSHVQAQTVLDQYIQEAYQSNLVLKEKKTGLDKSLLAIKEARSLFLPTTWFEAQYTLAQGGRSIDIPIGDLLNPVYNTLNRLTNSNSFPNVSNVKEQFLPNNFYDVRIKTTMPILNPDIKINQQIKTQEVQLKENEILIYKRELAKEIKLAYYNILMTAKAITILESALSVVQQNLRLNQSLLANGKGLPAYVARAESEVSNVENQLLNAKNNEQNATAYFNFLLNRNLTEAIIKEEDGMKDLNLQTMLAGEDDVQKREELKSLGIATGISNSVLKMNQSFRKPRLNAFLDLASQGFDFKVDRRSFFYLGGVQLQIPIYTGKRNLYKAEQTGFDLQRIRFQTEQTKQQLQLALFTSRNNVKNAYNSYRASVNQEQAAAQYFKLIDRGYKEGVNSFIEFLDARNQHTNAQLQLSINHYKFLAGLAEYERQAATYSINQ
ncbi:TolC family protein [Lacibacter sp. MH-610]|uniref:TolC family protein n=1 Tax=Lacibacter sp. MH-610 TaxID=3020883 RepID=UPI003892A9E8